MHDLLFTLPVEEYPFDREVRAAWHGGIFTISLVEHESLVSTLDTEEATATAALDSFLSQLVR
ncbi:MAG: hypothetical protein AAB131_09105 [Actinomycetota bacterium]